MLLLLTVFAVIFATAPSVIARYRVWRETLAEKEGERIAQEILQALLEFDSCLPDPHADDAEK